MTYREAVACGEQRLKESGISDAKTDAWLLLANVCGIDRNFYYKNMNEAMADEDILQYEILLKKRKSRIPLQYLTGEQDFCGLSFLVSPDVLIPRFDTEILVLEAEKLLKPEMEALDLCTGSGCIAITLKKSVPGIFVAASDISLPALRIAKENAKRNGAIVRFVESDLFLKIDGRFDVIVSNPPYIPTGEIASLMPEVRDFEPKLALDGKEDGLSFYRTIISESRQYLKPNGFLLLEIGCGQGAAVSALMEQAGYREVEIIKDLAGLDRVVKGGNYV